MSDLTPGLYLKSQASEAFFSLTRFLKQWEPQTPWSVGGGGGGSGSEEKTEPGRAGGTDCLAASRQIQNDFLNTRCCFQKNILGREYCTDVGVCWWGVLPIMLYLQSPK